MNPRSLQRNLLYIFFFSINFEVWDPFHTEFFSISKLTGLFYFLSVIPEVRKFLNTSKIKRLVNPLWIFFALLTVINILNINPVSSSFIDFSIFQNIILFIILYNHSVKEPGILEKGMLSFAIGSIVLSILYYFRIGVEYDGTRVRIFGDNENTIGLRMCISLIFLILFVLKNPLKLNKWRYLFFLSFPLMLTLMADTGSRVAFISFALCFITGLFLYKSKNTYTKIIIILIGIFVGIYIWNYITSSSVLLQRLLNSAENQDLSNRNIIWKSLLPIIESHPFFGIGETGYALFSTKSIGRILSPHNVILEVLCYVGFLGLSVYFFFLYQIFTVSFKKYKIQKLAIYLLLLIPLLGMILSGQILTTKIGWIIFAFAAGRTSKYTTRFKFRSIHRFLTA